MSLMLRDQSGGRRWDMKKLLLALLVAAVVAAALLAQGASAEIPHCTLGYCPPYNTGH
jgi:hypothetical protein